MAMSMGTQTVEVLRGARELVAHGWTQGAVARNSLGDAVDAHNITAVRWCLGGAVERSSLHFYQGSRAYAERILQEVCGGTTVIGWNDAPGRTLGEVLSLIDQAIQLGEGT